MNKRQLIREVANNLGKTQKEVREDLEGILSVIEKTLNSGEEVVITGFVKFGIKQTKARFGTNPQTHKKITIPARSRVFISRGSRLKRAVK